MSTASSNAPARRAHGARAAGSAGQAVASRLAVERLRAGRGRGAGDGVERESEMEGFRSRTKVWAGSNAWRNGGVTLIREDYEADVDRDYQHRRSCFS